ncbi:unnamed protein product [Ceutorhynchus assimilis]|uniref:Centrosomin N-terminal motif 1 domain-containing protein n=1 Tax=Ceutorhynchus assimilis TaxID=467358 RepID=A0A9P0DNK7_9CUCU|nr:unnamed protein product [Ceutorhynchus assimilis]
MANSYIKAVIKNTLGGSSPTPAQSYCASSRNSSVGDFDEFEQHTLGVRSPTGRTVKEVEQQLSNFKKENFDLKLRIYFLEEKMGVNYALDKDNVFRKNTELQVQVANLQRELKEKYDLLCQAVKALEMEEDEHRKYSANKEEEMAQVHEEMDELKMQLQDMRLMYTESTKSGCSSSRQSENVQFFASNQRCLDDELNTENQQQLASFIYDTSETLRQQIEDLQKDCDSKDQAIDSLTRQLSSANERLIDFAQQVKDYEEKLSEQHQRNTQLLTTMQSVNQKLTMTKLEFERERNEFMSEKKALDHTNAVLQMRVSALDDEKRQHKQLIRELQLKLDATAFDAKKKHSIAVSISRAATATGAAQANLHDAQVEQLTLQRSPSKSQVPLTPDAKHLVTFEKLLLSERCRDADMLRTEFSILKSDFHDQTKKIIKLKSEQLKACEIIKSMIKYRNQANDEIAQLKKAKEALEREMESVVGRPQRETANNGPVHARVSELNITAVGTPPTAPSCEVDARAAFHGRFHFAS